MLVKFLPEISGVFKHPKSLTYGFVFLQYLSCCQTSYFSSERCLAE